MSGPEVQLSLSSLRSNLSRIRGLLPRRCGIGSVLKADAYGHGSVELARVLGASREIDRFFVATIEEAVAIPATEKPLTVLRSVDLLLDHAQADALALGVARQWTFTVESSAAVDELAALGRRYGVPVNVEIMLDTGLSRCGVNAGQFHRLIGQVDRHPCLKLKSVATHFANAGFGDDAFTRSQIARFQTETDALAARRPEIVRHAAATGGMLNYPEAHFNAVRLGGAIFGIDPSRDGETVGRLQPILKLVAPLQSIREIEPGEPVGYGGTWRASRQTRLGLIPLGYHDGYPRHASNRAMMIVDGVACAVVGAVSMDSTSIDITDVAEPQLGQRVTVIDDDPTSPASALALARACGTIVYEILSRLGPRLRRRWVSETIRIESDRSRQLPSIWS